MVSPDAAADTEGDAGGSETDDGEDDAKSGSIGAVGWMLVLAGGLFAAVATAQSGGPWETAGGFVGGLLVAWFVALLLFD